MIIFESVHVHPFYENQQAPKKNPFKTKDPG